MPRKTQSKPLSDLQLVILSAAAGRHDRSALPWPKSLRAEPGARDAAVRVLLKRGHVHEEHGATKSKAWRVPCSDRRMAPRLPI